MTKLSDALKAVISFWCWVGVILLSFFMGVLLLAPVATPKWLLAILVTVIFIGALAVPVFNPGIFIKKQTAATGV